MHISHIDIQNFRKLKCCRVELDSKETVFVGANNSGKTSAMETLILFLKKSRRTNICTTDFTLSNWKSINKIGVDWVTNTDGQGLDLSRANWRIHLPCIDVWLHVNEQKIYYVSHLIPTLNWTGGLLGVRLILEPKKVDEFCKVDELYKAYKTEYSAMNKMKKLWADSSQDGPNGNNKKSFNPWPQSMRDFLDKNLHKYFSIHGYILDPSKCNDQIPQALPPDAEPIEGDPFDGLLKIDIINAQRGFSDPNHSDISIHTDRRLSTQLRQYFDKHLNPEELPEASDLDALVALEAAREMFDGKLKTSFSHAISELEEMNYPGFNNPRLMLSSKVNPLDGLNHDAAVQFNVLSETVSPALCLPEQYNGLGYQNLISMVFNLIRFRDEWMRIGKAAKRINNIGSFIEPLHLVLIEEPEAHLHAQAQQVFIKKAYSVLRKHLHLEEKDQFRTQLIVSTHSSHIAHEIDFRCLRYFKRTPIANEDDVPCATVVNLTTIFGSDEDSAKFAKRYLKTTHCDLFFADAAILVEGPAERLLLPHFIIHHYPNLNKSYISLLEIGGSHAHRLKPLIEALGLLTLVVTDLDSIDANTIEKKLPAKKKNYRTGNNTIKTWAPCLEQLDEVLNASAEQKITPNGKVCIAYQYDISVVYDDITAEEALPYTFEDALVLNNLQFFRNNNGSTGLIKKMSNAVSKPTLSEACKEMFNSLISGKKAEMALDLLFTTQPQDLKIPNYIDEGLKWLNEKLSPQFEKKPDQYMSTDGEK